MSDLTLNSRFFPEMYYLTDASALRRLTHKRSQTHELLLKPVRYWITSIVKVCYDNGCFTVAIFTHSKTHVC